MNRAADIAVAGAALVVASPLLGLAALAVKLQDGGPVLYRQSRVGKDGADFELLKLRTMIVGAEKQGAGFAVDQGDSRITAVGRFLRRTSLDELPQLWNVVRGDMSLVGPRPLIPLEHERAPGWAHARSQVRPGITGLWQVEGRTAVPFRDMLRLDQAYVATWSLRRDAEILLRTVPTVLTAKGAN